MAGTSVWVCLSFSLKHSMTGHTVVVMKAPVLWLPLTRVSLASVFFYPSFRQKRPASIYTVQKTWFSIINWRWGCLMFPLDSWTPPRIHDVPPCFLVEVRPGLLSAILPRPATCTCEASMWCKFIIRPSARAPLHTSAAVVSVREQGQATPSQAQASYQTSLFQFQMIGLWHSLFFHAKAPVNWVERD